MNAASASAAGMDHDQSARDACEEERFCFARKWISATIHAITVPACDLCQPQCGQFHDEVEEVDEVDEAEDGCVAALRAEKT